VIGKENAGREIPVPRKRVELPAAYRQFAKGAGSGMSITGKGGKERGF